MGDSHFPACHICGHEKKNMKHWRDDMASHLGTHRSEKIFLCTMCGKHFSQIGSLNLHLKMVHKKVKPSDLLYCHSCPYSTANLQDLHNHVLTHFGKTVAQHACGICGKKFVLLQNKNRHLKTHEKRKASMCETCGRRFNHRGNLKQHNCLSTERDDHKCHLCSFKSNYKLHLQRHINQRHGQTSAYYQCTACSHTTTQRGSMNKHINLDTTARNYKCLKCGATYRGKDGLNYHMKTNKC